MNLIRDILSHIHPVDLIFILVVFIFAIRGIFRGFIEIVLNTVALWGGLILGWLFYRPFAEVLAKIGLNKGASIISFLVIFLAVYFVVKLIESFVKRITENRSLNNLDKALGFFMGAVQGATIFIIVLFASILLLTPFYDVTQWYQGSLLFEVVEKWFTSLSQGGSFNV